jgi:hypothetical protein
LLQLFSGEPTLDNNQKECLAEFEKSERRVCPGDPDGVDIRLGTQIDHHPLRVKRVVLAREGLG